LPQLDASLSRSETNSRGGDGLLAFRTRGALENMRPLSGSCFRG
jgi:hypothetical protein